MIFKLVTRFVFIIFLFLLASKHSPVFAQLFEESALHDTYTGPYSIKDAQFAIWNGFAYIPVFIKGINMGNAVPGTQPGELAATLDDLSPVVYLFILSIDRSFEQHQVILR